MSVEEHQSGWHVGGRWGQFVLGGDHFVRITVRLAAYDELGIEGYDALIEPELADFVSY